MHDPQKSMLQTHNSLPPFLSWEKRGRELCACSIDFWGSCIVYIMHSSNCLKIFFFVWKILFYWSEKMFFSCLKYIIKFKDRLASRSKHACTVSRWHFGNTFEASNASQGWPCSRLTSPTPRATLTWPTGSTARNEPGGYPLMGGVHYIHYAWSPEVNATSTQLPSPFLSWETINDTHHWILHWQDRW